MKNVIISIILGVLLIGIGTGLFLFELTDYEYIDEINEITSLKTETYTYKLDKEIRFNNTDNINVFIDNNVAENTVLVEVNYYDLGTFLKVKDYSSFSTRNIEYYLSGTINSFGYFYDFFLDSLKDKKIYNLEKLSNIDISLYVNSKDIEKFDNYNTNESKFYLRDETEMCAEMLEKIYEDNQYIYYLPCLQSETIFVIYNDGYKESIRSALNKNNVTIEELINKGLEVIKEDL